MPIPLLSAIFGFVGSVLIFFFGIPPKISKDGAIYLILEQQDKKEAKKYIIYKTLGYLGIIFIGVSFLINIFMNII